MADSLRSKSKDACRVADSTCRGFGIWTHDRRRMLTANSPRLSAARRPRARRSGAAPSHRKNSEIPTTNRDLARTKPARGFFTLPRFTATAGAQRDPRADVLLSVNSSMLMMNLSFGTSARRRPPPRKCVHSPDEVKPVHIIRR